MDQATTTSPLALTASAGGEGLNPIPGGLTVTAGPNVIASAGAASANISAARPRNRLASLRIWTLEKETTGAGGVAAAGGVVSLRAEMAGLGRTIPALPVRDIGTAVAHYRDRLGFTALHVDDGFAVLERDDARLHLWQAADRGWTDREDLRERPIDSGAESFLAGTASCRIETEDVDALYAELSAADVLHPVSRDGVSETDFGTREFATLDADGNLIEFFRWLS